MTVFEDASAIVARYSSEPGRRQGPPARVVVMSALSQVEVTSAMWRKQRIGELSPDQARALVDGFLSELRSQSSGPDTVHYLAVSVSADVLDAAVVACGVHGLRAYDAVQLASAIRARAADPSITDFETYDVSLHRAAAIEGFRVNQLG